MQRFAEFATLKLRDIGKVNRASNLTREDMRIECVKPCNAKAAFTVGVIVAGLTMTSCGGGGGSSGGPQKAAVIKQSNLALSWNLPTRRENEEHLSAADIQSCVILYFRESELINAFTVFPDYIDSFTHFVSKSSQIGNFISGVDLSEIISTGSPNAVLIPSSEISNYTFYDVKRGTYYFSVTCSDWDDLYSELSTTVSINIP